MTGHGGMTHGMFVQWYYISSTSYTRTSAEKPSWLAEAVRGEESPSGLGDLRPTWPVKMPRWRNTSTDWDSGTRSRRLLSGIFGNKRRVGPHGLWSADKLPWTISCRCEDRGLAQWSHPRSHWWSHWRNHSRGHGRLPGLGLRDSGRISIYKVCRHILEVTVPQPSVLGQVVDRSMEILVVEKKKLDCLQLRSVCSDLSFSFQ